MTINIIDIIQAVSPFVEAELLELVAIGDQVTTADGRWEAFQDWLKAHPRWRRTVDRWMGQKPEMAYVSIKQALLDQSNSPKFLSLAIRQFVTKDLEARIVNAIETLQVLYRERKQTTATTPKRIASNGKRKRKQA